MNETHIVVDLDGYQPEVGAALWRLEDARRRTLEMLSHLPADYVDREANGNTIGTILYHMALIETDWLCAEILEEPYPEQLQLLLPVDHRDQEGLLTHVRGQALEQHLDRLQAVRKYFLDRLREMTTEDFNRPRHLPYYDVSPAWVLHHLSQHEAEHRGELGSAITLLKAGG